MGITIKRILRRLFLIVLVILLGFAMLRYRFRDVIFRLTQTHVKNSTSDLINDAIDRQIETGNIRYDRIVYFEKDLDGRITALKTNMSEVNRLKTDILNIINDEILALDKTDIGIHAGSIVLPELFSGRGVLLPVQILAIRNSEASLHSDFTEAGINQTLHRLNMFVNIDVTVLVLGKTEDFTITSQVIVAETVIVGQVPDTLLKTGGNG